MITNNKKKNKRRRKNPLNVLDTKSLDEPLEKTYELDDIDLDDLDDLPQPKL